MLLMVSYDLHRKPEANYEKLIEWLRASKGERILYSQWLLDTSWNAVQVRDAVTQHIGADDLALVVEVTSPGWAATNTVSARALKMLQGARACR